MLNSINYRSAVGYWRHPIQVNGDSTTKLGRGSGINFGCSVPLVLLEKIAQDPKDAKHQAVLSVLATYLAIHPLLLEIFLEISEFKEIRKQPELFERLPEVLLLESSFPFTDKFIDTAFTLKQKGDDVADAQNHNYIPSPKHYRIENILEKKETRAFVKAVSYTHLTLPTNREV